MLTFPIGRRRLSTASVTLVAAAIALTCFTTAAHAFPLLTPGALDPTFSADGIAMPSITTSTLESAVTLNDGSTVAVGTRRNMTLVEKYTPGGELDPTFGGGDGVVTFRPIEYSHRARFLEGENHIFVTTDGTFRIVRTATIANSGFFFGAHAAQLQVVTFMTAVTKIGTSGIVDTTFGNQGTFATRAQHAFDATFIASSAVAPDGTTVFARVGGKGPTVEVTRVNANGKADATWGGGDGKSTVVLTRGGATAKHIKVANDGVLITSTGKVVVAVTLRTNRSRPQQSLVRFTSVGKLDSAFGVNGQLARPFPVTQISSPYYTAQPLVRSDDSFYVASVSNKPQLIHINRYLPSGLPDTSFGGDGEIVSSWRTLDAGTSPVFAMTMTSTGELYLFTLGSSGGGNLARYDNNGTLDATFARSRLNLDALASTSTNSRLFLSVIAGLNDDPVLIGSDFPTSAQIAASPTAGTAPSPTPGTAANPHGMLVRLNYGNTTATKRGVTITSDTTNECLTRATACAMSSSKKTVVRGHLTPATGAFGTSPLSVQVYDDNCGTNNQPVSVQSVAIAADGSFTFTVPHGPTRRHVVLSRLPDGDSYSVYAPRFFRSSRRRCR